MPTQPSSAYAEQAIWLTPIAVSICKTVILLERAYAASYLTQVLAGDKFPQLRKDHHGQLETFGCLDQLNQSKIEDIIYYMVSVGWLELVDQRLGTLQLTEQGHSFLQDPPRLDVKRKDLFKKWYHTELHKTLKIWRKETAAGQAKSPYELFTNHTLFQIVWQLPTEQTAWLQIQGLDNLTDPQRVELANLVSEAQNQKHQDEQTGMYTKAFSPSHRKIKELYQAGFSLADMAARRDIKVNTVAAYLRRLHQTNQIDLRPWIEANVPAELLHKGASYFKSAADKRLGTAHQTLDIDFETLKWCQIYAAADQAPSAKNRSNG